jgi:hypothetical protein
MLSGNKQWFDTQVVDRVEHASTVNPLMLNWIDVHNCTFDGVSVDCIFFINFAGSIVSLYSSLIKIFESSCYGLLQSFGHKFLLSASLIDKCVECFCENACL